MSDIRWVTLLEVPGRLEAEIIKEALIAQGISAEIFQEGAMHYAYPMAVGPLANVQVCVPNSSLRDARAWLAEYEAGNLEDGTDQSDGQQEDE